ncbi:MAG: hypothetical protein EYC70_00010 [Planctomycetota bacterium]|nr:MAG: hypothetical protein EYC70_00010 [Planctomycetota bacterium]
MLCFALALLLTHPLQDPSPQRESYSGSDLATLAGLDASAAALTLSGGQSAHWILPAPAPARSLGVWWHGGFAAASVELLDAAGAAEAVYPLAESADMSAASAGTDRPAGDARVSALTHAYGAPVRAVRLRITGPARIADLSLIWIAPPGGIAPAAPQPMPGGAARGYPKPSVYSRAQWGADAPQCGSGYCNTTHLGFHHSAGASEYNSSSWAQCAANVRAIQDYHMFTNGWCDIGYNYLVCVHGDIFEGRAGGDNVRGAHDGWNCGSMGTCWMGYFHTPYHQTLTPAMLDASCELGAWKCDQQGIDPWGSSWYAGYGGSMTNVYGHRNVSATACPGDLAYSQLDTIRAGIEARLSGGGTEVILDNSAAAFTGSWSTGTSSGDKYGPDYRWSSTGTSRAKAWWTPDIPQAGSYTVHFWWPQGANRNPQTRVGVRVNGVIHAVTVNQQQNGGRWNAIGTWTFPAGTGSLVGLDNSGPGGYVVVADAIRLVQN